MDRAPAPLRDIDLQGVLGAHWRRWNALGVPERERALKVAQIEQEAFLRVASKETLRQAWLYGFDES